MTADLRVGIVSWNTAQLLDRCLDALPAALDGLEAEIVVVDNASDDDSAARAGRHVGVEVIVNDENVGYARGMNRALAGTSAPVLVALNPDTEPPPGSLRTLVERLHETGAGIVVPRLANADGTLQHSVYRFPSLAVAAAVALPGRFHSGRLGRRFWLEGGASHQRGGPVDWAIGAVHVIHRGTLDDPDRAYTERWFMYVEDLELCHRLGSAGRPTWLAADVEIPHVGNAAGAQKWGDQRERRWWWATYDFVHLTSGDFRLRALASVHTVSTAAHALGAATASLRRRPGRRRHRRTAVALARLIGLHAEVAVRGASAITDQRAGRQPGSGPPR